MKVHERTHETSTLKFKCKLCPDKTYPCKNSFQFHEYLAHKKRVYKCGSCDYVALGRKFLRIRVPASHRVISPELTRNKMKGASVCAHG